MRYHMRDLKDLKVEEKPTLAESLTLWAILLFSCVVW